MEVGVRELREHLAEWLDRAAAGEEILVTERGRPKALLRAPETAFEQLIREGTITPRTGTGRPRLPRQLDWRGEGPTLSDYLTWSRGGRWPGPEPEPGVDDASG